MSNKPKVIAVAGPTASGKTDIAIAIAREFNGEVISADSRQVYRGLDIGTAKVTPEEMQGVKHHLIDICDVDEVYTGERFVRDAAAAIDDIESCGYLPVIAGGTFFYLQLLRGVMHAAPVAPDLALRADLEEKTDVELLALLQEKDPLRAEIIDPHNRRRLIRALEIVETLGSVPVPAASDSPYDMLLIGLTTEKEDLRARFRSRAEDWLARGFQAEVEGLLARGVGRARLQEIGFEYTLMLELIDHALTKEEFVQKFIEKNWQYAKRQLTWLKREESIEWYAREDSSAILARVRTFLTASD